MLTKKQADELIAAAGKFRQATATIHLAVATDKTAADKTETVLSLLRGARADAAFSLGVLDGTLAQLSGTPPEPISFQQGGTRREAETHR